MSNFKLIVKSVKRFKQNWPELTIILIFIAYRIFFLLNGGSFISKTIYFAKQYLDPLYLKDDLLRSIFYLHSQPPLFNLLLGTVLKISPAPSLTFELIFRTIGLLIPLLFYGILILIGIKRIPAFWITIVFMFNPTLILYENLLYYTYLEAFLILLAIFFLLRWLIDKIFYNLIFFWISMLCLGMIRSLFQPVFFIVTTFIMALYLRYFINEKKLAWKFFLSSSVVIIPMFTLCLKNLILFGFFWYFIMVRHESMDQN